MVKFDFEKILKLSALNQQFFDLSLANTVWKMIFKFIFLLLFSPVYLAVSLLVSAMYLVETLLTIPSKLVHGIRVANTPFDEKNRVPFNVSYILLYIWVTPFDVLTIFFSWFIAIFSLVLDLIANIVCLGDRHLAAFELCFAAEEGESDSSRKHFWMTVLGVVLLAAIFVLGGKIASLCATSYEEINTGIEIIKVEKIDSVIYKVVNYNFLAIAYLLPTVLLTVFYSRKKRK